MLGLFNEQNLFTLNYKLVLPIICNKNISLYNYVFARRNKNIFFHNDVLPGYNESRFLKVDEYYPKHYQEYKTLV